MLKALLMGSPFFGTFKEKNVRDQHHRGMGLGLPSGRDGSHWLLCWSVQWGHITGTPKGFLDTQF